MQRQQEAEQRRKEAEKLQKQKVSESITGAIVLKYFYLFMLLFF